MSRLSPILRRRVVSPHDSPVTEIVIELAPWAQKALMIEGALPARGSSGLEDRQSGSAESACADGEI